MGCAPMAHLLWNETMSYSSSDPSWWNRDRFVLSNGHASALQYTMLHLAGYKDTLMEDLKQFRQLGSKTPGHPESFATAGIEVCTGPLGQGISNAVGLAMAERHLAATYNKTSKFSKLVDHYTYVICGDGCLQEGVSSESSSLAGHLGLGKLIVLYDDNNITIDGSTDLSFTEDVTKRYDAYGWHTLTVKNVSNGLKELRKAIKQAQKETSRPTMIKIRTAIGYGSALEGTAKIHGAPLKDDDYVNTKRNYGLDPEKSFHVDEDVQGVYKKSTAANEKKKQAWDNLFVKYQKAYPEEAAELERRFTKNKLPDGILEKLPIYEYGQEGSSMATRKFSQACLNAIGSSLPELMGGSADLTPSNLTSFGGIDFQKATPEGRYVRFGVREHGMCAISNGLFAHGAIRPYCATFLVFSGYAMGAIRLSALSQFPIIYIMTHDSIGVGEDGPTHQPIETLENLRSIPNLNVMRPADGNETSAAYQLALTSEKTPTVICCSRSTVPALEHSSKEKALKGAYVCWPGDAEEEPDLILIATGTEVSHCCEAAKKLPFKTRVVSMPCQDLFLEQPINYQESILPGNVPTLSVEASTVHGWHRFAHAHISVNEFGRSGKGGDVFKVFGFTCDNVMEKANALMEFYDNQSVPHLRNRPLLFDGIL